MNPASVPLLWHVRVPDRLLLLLQRLQGWEVTFAGSEEATSQYQST